MSSYGSFVDNDNIFNDAEIPWGGVAGGTQVSKASKRQ